MGVDEEVLSGSYDCSSRELTGRLSGFQGSTTVGPAAATLDHTCQAHNKIGLSL